MSTIVDITKLPMAYRCIGCDAEGVKLWRSYNLLLDDQTLKCRACSEVEQRVVRPYVGGDSIGWRIPAIPEDSGDFWLHKSAPDGAIAWWRALPEVDARKESS